jgi:hypothetical protein
MDLTLLLESNLETTSRINVTQHLVDAGSPSVPECDEIEHVKNLHTLAKSKMALK